MCGLNCNALFLHRMLLRLPLVLIGWDKEQQVVKLPLFKRFRERADMPFCIFKAALQVSITCTLQPERSSWLS